MRSVALKESKRKKTETPDTARMLRALIVEDSEDDLELLLLHLKESGYHVKHTLVQGRDEFRAALRNGDFDAVLSDYNLPGWSGLDAIRELQKAGRDIPFLLITGTLGEEAAVECIKQGATDYILKDRLSRLPGALSRALAEKALRDQNAKTQDALRLLEARNRDLVENSVYGIFRFAKGEFLDANPASLRIIGCIDPAELKKLNLERDIFRFPEEHARLMAECREKGQVHRAEAEWRRCDGGFVMVRLHLRRLLLPEQPEILEIIAEDVTELRALERQVGQAQ